MSNTCDYDLFQRIKIMENNYFTIKIKGHIDNNWSHLINNMNITLEDDGTTSLKGTVQDQSALHGLLNAIHDMGLILISFNYHDTYKISIIRENQ
jgi:hypothetical protein